MSALGELTPSSGARTAVVRFLLGWGALCAACLLTLLVVFLVQGKEGLKLVVQRGPNSNLYLTVYSVALAWGLAGLTLWLVVSRRVNASNGVPFAGFLALALLYLNVLRERIVYGDVGDYIAAASSLHFGTRLPVRYLYPPLWATMLEPLVPLGDNVIFHICWLLNLLSLFVMYFLLHRTLVRYGFSSQLAALAALVFSAINVPILRTLGYVQINFHVTNLVLASLLCYPRHRLLSALALAFAAHLKVSPLALVISFLVIRDFRWLLWFVACLAGVALVPLAMHGPTPYLEFVGNVRNIYAANPLSYRDNSLDSFFRATALIMGLPGHWLPILIGTTKLLLVTACIVVGIASVRRRSFVAGEGPAATLYNMVPSLLIMIVMASPLVWEHHPVLLGLSYLVVVKGLSTVRQWLWFGFAYFLEFFLPTFDFFPWSYGRLVSPIIWLGLVWALRQNAPSVGFRRANEFLAGFSLDRIIAPPKPAPEPPNA